MSYFSNISTALAEKQHGRGREAVYPGAVGVCLDDSGVPVRLYSVETIWRGGLWLTVQNVETGEERTIQPCDFWALV